MKHNKLYRLAALPLAIQSSIAFAGHISGSEFNITSQNTYDSQFRDSSYFFSADEVNINFIDDQTISGNAGYLKLSTTNNSNTENRILNFNGVVTSGKRVSLNADSGIANGKPLIDVQVGSFGLINFSNLNFNGNNTQSSAVRIDDDNSKKSTSIVFDQLSFDNVEFADFDGYGVIQFDEKNVTKGGNLTVKKLSIKNSKFINNDIISDKTYSISNHGSLFIIDAEASDFENLNISGNTAERYLFSLSSGVASLTSSEISNNTSSYGILFDAQTYTQNDSYENYGQLVLSGLKVNYNEVTGSYGILNIQKYNTVESSNNEFNHNITAGNGGALNVSAAGGAAVGISGITDFSDVGSVFKDNEAEYGGALYFSGINAKLTDSVISGNTANYGSGIYFSSYAQYNNLNLDLKNVSLTDNKGSDGALYLDLTNNEYPAKGDVIFGVNISADNKDIVWQGNCDENGDGSDVVIRFNGSSDNAQANINLYSINGGSLTLSNGISTVRRGKTEEDKNSVIGTADIKIGHMDDGTDVQDSKVILGGLNSFDGPVTNFTIYAGSLDLLESSRLVWENEKTSDASTGAFLAKSGSVFNVHLNSVSSDNVSDHAGLAPIDLGGNEFTMEAGSNLNISINGVQSLRSSSDQGWLIVAANAELTQETDPKISFTDKNWLYDFSEGQKLQQGMTESNQIVSGTEENIYIGYNISDNIHPDQDAVKLSNATSHFAVSAIRSISNSVTNYYRPKHANTFWVLPQYIHDNRDTDDLGVGFDAQLRAVTIGNDLIFDNGYWGFGIGYGDGNIHSNGGIAYTNGDIQSLWGIGYFKYKGESFNVFADVSYLYQDADQEQNNVVGPLYTNTTNDAVLVNLGISKDFVLSKDDLSQWILSPSLGVEYIYLNQRDFDINLDNGTTILHGDDNNMSMFSIPVEATLQYDFADDDLKHNFHLTLGASKNFGDKSMSGSYTDLNGRNADKWELIPVDDYQGKVGLGYTLYSSKKDISIDLGVNYVFSNSRELTDIVGAVTYNW